MTNIFRQAYDLITEKTCGELTDDDIKMVNEALGLMINTLPQLEPIYDELPISEGLLRLAELVESK